jgi:hypothetical protein
VKRRSGRRKKLEAHSGLGELLEDPLHVNVRMRGATPPATYVLKPREKLFHGVRALLNPIGSGDAMGRAGLLVHPFLALMATPTAAYPSTITTLSDKPMKKVMSNECTAELITSLICRFDPY